MGSLTVKRAVLALISIVFLAQSVVAEVRRGPVTNLPMPRYVSLKASEGNVRRGPSLSHRIDWILMRRDMPLQVVAEHGHWRKVIDHEGAGGWIHYALLSGTRTVLIRDDMLKIYQTADPNSQIQAILQTNVLARLGQCQHNWCRITADGHRGWAPKSALWGVGLAELRD